MSVGIQDDASANLAAKSEAQERTTATAQRASFTWIDDVRVLLLGLWLGAALFFSFAVAPNAFAVLRSFHLPNAAEIAGAIVSRALGVVNTGGFIISLILLASSFPIAGGASKMFARRAEAASLVLLMIATGVGQWVIAARMQALRASIGGPMEELAQSDPVRAAFSSLHVYSVAALGLGMIAAAVASLLITRRKAKRPVACDGKSSDE